MVIMFIELTNFEIVFYSFVTGLTIMIIISYYKHVHKVLKKEN